MSTLILTLKKEIKLLPIEQQADVEAELDRLIGGLPQTREVIGMVADEVRRRVHQS